MREPAQRYQDTLYRFQSQASKGVAVPVYRIDEMQMLEPTEGYSYIISTSSHNTPYYTRIIYKIIHA